MVLLILPPGAGTAPTPRCHRRRRLRWQAQPLIAGRQIRSVRGSLTLSRCRRTRRHAGTSTDHDPAVTDQYDRKRTSQRREPIETRPGGTRASGHYRRRDTGDTGRLRPHRGVAPRGQPQATVAPGVTEALVGDNVLVGQMMNEGLTIKTGQRTSSDISTRCWSGSRTARPTPRSSSPTGDRWRTARRCTESSTTRRTARNCT